MGVLAGNTEILTGIFAGISESILVTDEIGRFIDANPAALELLGYSLEELLKLRVPDIVASDPKAVDSEFSRYLKEGSWSGEYELKTRQGELVPVEIRASVIALPQRTLYVSSIRNITERITTK